jgi:hypothetical protein
MVLAAKHRIQVSWLEKEIKAEIKATTEGLLKKPFRCVASSKTKKTQ